MATISLTGASTAAPTLANTLAAYYQAKDVAGTSGAVRTASAKPIAPWNASPVKSATSLPGKSSATTSSVQSLSVASSLAVSLLGGTKLIDPSTAKLSVSTNNANANSDYKNLFALYKGLTSLQTLATAAGGGSVPASELAQLQKAFTSGLSQVQSFITGGPFREFKVADGTVTANDQSTVGAPVESDGYTTGLKASSLTAALPGLAGDVQFSMTVTKLHQQPFQVNFNLADMGSTPRSLSNVVSYLNSRLAAAGVTTKFANQLLPNAAPSPSPVASTGSKTAAPAVTAASAPPQFALTIKGTALEGVAFTASTTSPAVYVAEIATAPGSGATATPPPASKTTPASASSATASAPSVPSPESQLLKLDPTGAHAVNTAGKVWSDNLPSGASVQATQTSSDGSIYVLANVTRATGGQTIQGAQDVALLKYDTAGDLMFTRTLGAASTASGYALAVAPGGGQVAVAGTSAGDLAPATSTAATSAIAQSFVAVYDSGGNELWTNNETATADNQVNGVAFGANNSVYVAGTTQSRLPGANSAGGQDAYLQGFTATQARDFQTGGMAWTAKSSFIQQFGSSGVDRATGVAVDGGSVYVSSVESGDAVVRRYDLATPSAPVLAAKQDLGALGGGNLAGIAVGANGVIDVAGSTHDGALNAGQVTSAYAGGGSAFVAQLSANLDPTGGEDIAYYEAGSTTTATGLTEADGGVYITGQVATGASPAGGSVSELGYAAEINPVTGSTVWSQTFKGTLGNAAPSGVAVGSTGSSALDALGLPQGSLSYTQPNTVVANTSLRPGDEFYVQVGGGVPAAVTIAADDTYATLATKIERAGGFQLSATTTTGASGEQQVKIAPTSKSANTQVSIEAGPVGRDALQGLGLKAGLVTNTSSYAPSAVAGVTSAVRGAYTVNVPNTLSLNSATSAKAAAAQIGTAIAELQSVYYDMNRAKTVAAGAHAPTDTTQIAFYNAEAAANRNALARLGA